MFFEQESLNRSLKFWNVIMISMGSGSEFQVVGAAALKVLAQQERYASVLQRSGSFPDILQYDNIWKDCFSSLLQINKLTYHTSVVKNEHFSHSRWGWLVRCEATKA